jgi:hypothetical protein
MDMDMNINLKMNRLLLQNYIFIYKKLTASYHLLTHFKQRTFVIFVGLLDYFSSKRIASL